MTNDSEAVVLIPLYVVAEALVAIRATSMRSLSGWLTTTLIPGPKKFVIFSCFSARPPVEFEENQTQESAYKRHLSSFP